MTDFFLGWVGFLVFLLRTPQTQLPQAKQTDRRGDRPTEAPSDCERGRQSEKDSQTDDDGNEKHGGFEATFHLVKRSHERTRILLSRTRQL